MHISVLLIPLLIPWSLAAPSRKPIKVRKGLLQKTNLTFIQRDGEDGLPTGECDQPKRPRDNDTPFMDEPQRGTSIMNDPQRGAPIMEEIRSCSAPIKEEPKKCIFENGRKTVLGKITRPPFSEVSAKCTGDPKKYTVYVSSY